MLELGKVKLFTYITVHTEIAKAGPGFDDWPEPPFVQINSSSPLVTLVAQIFEIHWVFSGHKTLYIWALLFSSIFL